MTNQTIRSRPYRKRLNLGFLIAIIAVVLVFGVLLISHMIKPKAGPNSEDKIAKTTSKSPSAQNNFTGGEARPTSVDNKKEGVVVDKKGVTDTIPPESQWNKSANNSLIIYSPSTNDVVADGEALQGASSYSKVYFRLSDSISGVIAQGSLDVVNGRYSGVLHFSTNSRQGEIEVFNQAADGRESNNVSVLIRF